MSRSPRIALVLLAVLSALSLPADPASSAEPAPLRYRRIYVEQSDLDAQIRGLLPLKRSEFDRRIAQAELRGEALAALTQARIERAVYRARIDKDSLVGGTAELTVSARNVEPAVLVLGNCNLPLERAIWNGTMSQPAQLGNLPDGRLACVIPRSGMLSFDWTLAGRRDERGSLSFEIVLPLAPVTRLELDLPPGMSLTAAGGIASRPDSAGSDRTSNRWLVEAGGSSRLVLHVIESSQSAPAEPLWLVREANDYQVQASAVDLESTLKLDILRQPIRQLTIAYDESLTLTQVRLGSQVLEWSPLTAGDSQRRAIVHFPEPLAGTDIAVSFSGVSNLPAETKQPLPRVRVEQAIWQSGEATLSAPADLPLDVTPHTGCWQTGFSEASAARPLATWRFQQVQADAAIEIAAVRTLPLLALRSGLALDVQPTQVQATLTAELTATNHPIFDIAARIPRTWIVDAVEVQPADWLEDRTLQTQGTGPQLLRLRLRQPIAPGRPLGVVLRAHRRRPADDQPLESEAWTLWRLADVGAARQLIELRSSDPAVQLALAGDTHVRRLDPAALAAADRKLFDAPPTGILLDNGSRSDGSRADGVRVRLAPTIPRFAAQVAVRAEFDEAVLQLTSRLVVRPDDSLVAALTVHISPPPQGAVAWSIVGEDARELVVQRIVPPVPNPAEAVYDLRLQRPRRNPIEILASFSQPFVSPHIVPLASLPGAVSQTGIVEIHSPNEMPLSIEGGDLRAIPPLDRRATELATLRGTYQYSPDRAAELRVVSRPAERTLPRLWIEELSARSQISVGGAGDHEMHLQVRNFGRRELIVSLDPAAAHLQVDVQGRRLLGNLASRKPNEYVIPLPPAQRELAIRLAYTSPPGPSAWLPFADLAIPWPQFPVPVLRSEWQVQLAPGIARRDSAPAVSSPIAGVWGQGATTAADARGTWRQLRTPGGPTATVVVYRTSTVSALAWGIALLVAAIVVRVAASGAGWLAALAGALAALAWTLPPVGAALVGGAICGVALGAAIGLVRPSCFATGSPRDRSSRSRNTPSFLRPQTAIVLLLVFTACAVMARAAPPDDAATFAPGSWRRVVIAVDADRQPVGEYVFLEPEFYDELLRLTDRDAAALPGWMVQAATYRPMFAPSADKGLALEALHVSLDLETFAGDQAVLLPLARREVRLVEGGSLLDGKAAVVEWNADERLAVSIPQAGQHRLELSLTPAPGGGKMALVDLSIPTANASRLDLPTASEMPRVLSDEEISLLPVDAAGRQWRLGPIGRLRLLPPLPKDGPTGAASVEGEQLVLWTVRPGSAAAEGKFRLHPVGGQITEATIEFDPQLRVLPLAAGGPVARQWITETSGPSRLHLSLREPAATEVSLAVAFAWSGSSGIGEYALPAIKLRCDKTVRDWSALSLVGGLDWKSPPERRTSDPTPLDLTAAWGPALPAGMVAFDMASPGERKLAIAPAPSQLHADEQLECNFSLTTAAVGYLARLDGIPPHGFQHRLAATEGLRISRLAVQEGERPVRAQWYQEAGGTVHVQLAEPPPAALQIEAQGELTLPLSVREPSVPLVQYQGAATGSFVVSLARQPAVQMATSAPAESWEAVPDPTIGRLKHGDGRLTAVYRRLPGSPPAALQVSISPNTPEVTGLSLARLVPEKGAWELDLRCVLDITGGRLDAVRWELPAAEQGPLAITPAAEHEWTTLAGAATRRLLVRPQLSAADKLAMQVRMPLSAADAGGSIGLAGLLDWPQVRRLVALPQRDGERRLRWATSGLQAVDPTHLSLPAEWLPPGYELLEVVADKPTVAAEVRTATAPQPTLLLADSRLQLHPGGLLTGTSQLDLLPGGLRTATLAVPPGQRLLHVSVEGIPAQLVERGGGQWSFGTAGARVPQRIEIVFAGAVKSPAARARLAAPVLLEAKALRSLWTVAGAAETSGKRAEQTPPSIVRLEAQAAAVQALADPAARDLPPAALRQAFEAAEDRFRAAEAELPAELSAPLAARARAATEQLNAARQRLVAAGISLLAAAPPARPAVPASPAVWQLVSDEHVPSIELAWASNQNAPEDWRLIWAGASLGAGLAGWWLLASCAGRSWLARHGALVAAASGFAWLAVGPAPWLGGLLAALALWSALRSPWLRESAAAGNAASSISRQPVR